jgi:hypothetical protein
MSGAGRARTDRERERSLSETVYQGDDGSAVALEDVLVMEEEDHPQPGDWPPDRTRDPWAWEMWWRPVMRPGHVGGLYRAYRLVPVVWRCQYCGNAIGDVRSKGRPPRFCSRACRQAAYRVRVTKCPQLSRGPFAHRTDAPHPPPPTRGVITRLGSAPPAPSPRRSTCSRRSPPAVGD